MSPELIFGLVTILLNRGWDAVKWAENRHVVMAVLNEWHARVATDEEKLSAIDAKLAEIDANSAILQKDLKD